MRGLQHSGSYLLKCEGVDLHGQQVIESAHSCTAEVLLTLFFLCRCWSSCLALHGGHSQDQARGNHSRHKIHRVSASGGCLHKFDYHVRASPKPTARHDTAKWRCITRPRGTLCNSTLYTQSLHACMCAKNCGWARDLPTSGIASSLRQLRSGSP